MSTNEQDLTEERRQFARLQELAEQMADECPWMWRIGDGYGGHVQATVIAAFAARGMNLEPRTPSLRKQLSTRRSLQVFARDNYSCTACGAADDLSVDHIQPVSKGGTNEMSNLQTLCRSCNSAKGAKWGGDA